MHARDIVPEIFPLAVSHFLLCFRHQNKNQNQGLDILDNNQSRGSIQNVYYSIPVMNVLISPVFVSESLHDDEHHLPYLSSCAKGLCLQHKLGIFTGDVHNKTFMYG